MFLEEGKNKLKDIRQEKFLISEIDYVTNNKNIKTIVDYGLIKVISNPFNEEKRIIILAGIHGAGTLGAALYVSEINKLKELFNRKINEEEGIEEVVIAKCQGNRENIISVQLLNS